MANKQFIFMLFSSLPFVVLGDSVPFSSFSKLQLPPKVVGPESVPLDLQGLGPYVGVTDGRILKYLGPLLGFFDFAQTAPHRNKQLCDGTTNPDLGPVCGRPLGLSFGPTGNLYITDGYFGLLVVGPTGGLATQIANSAEGVPFRFLTGVDVDQVTGVVYFTDASTTFELRNTTQPGFQFDSTGRLMKYDPITKQITVLIRGLAGAGGPALSCDRTFVIVSEFLGKRVRKYWLTGPKANTDEIIINFTGNPSKIKRSPSGDFWVPVNVKTLQPTLLTVPQGVRIDGNGEVLETISFATQYINTSITVVQEQGSALYVGSRFADFVGVFRR